MASTEQIKKLLCIHTMEYSSADTWNNMDEFQKYVEWKISDTKEYMLHNLIYLKFKFRSN